MDKAFMLLLLIVAIWVVLIAIGEGDLPSLSGPRVTESPVAQADSEDLNSHNPASESIPEAPVNSSDAAIPLTLVWGGGG
ncbi:MAG: hypothetical protein U9R05_06660 [Chloroflexota bacterium]|nr:hypothetical protein [Chloroflexota bacterium]